MAMGQKTAGGGGAGKDARTEDGAGKAQAGPRPNGSHDALLLSVHARLSASHDLDEQLAELMAIITDAVDAERATLFLEDARHGELYARIAVGDLKRELRLLSNEGVAGAVFSTGHSAVVPDVTEDERFDARFDELTGFSTRSLLAVPLRDPGGTIVGVAQALNRRSGSFGEADRLLLEAIAEQAAMVLRNTLFVEQVERANRQESEFLDLVSEVSTEIQLVPLLQKIMAAVTRMLDAERSTLFLNDEKAGELYTEIGQGLGATKIRLPNDVGIAGAVFTTGETINIPYAYADLRFNPSFDKQTGFFTRSILCVPVANKDGKRIGATQVLNKRGGAFTEEDAARLKAFTAQISIGLENAKLFDDVQTMKQYNDRILASMSNGVLTFGVDGAVVTCNAAGARILRVDETAVVGRSAESLFAGENAWVHERIAAAVADGEAELAVDVALEVGEEGQRETVSVNLTALPLADGSGDPLGSMVLLEDISSEKRVRATMARYVDASVADRLLEAGAEALGGRAGVATVLFSDVRKFTPLTERLGPQAIVALLNDYFTRMVGCIEAESGLLDKYIGDAIMAVFGVPFAHEDDPDRAVRAAVAMMRALRAMNDERATREQAPLEIGIGIHTGDVFSGNIGSPRRMDFTVMGDGVNLASRLEGLTKQYAAEVLISDFTLQSLKSTFRTREVDRVIVVGRREPVSIHEVLDYHDDESFPNLLDTLYAYRNGIEFYRKHRFKDAVAAFGEALTHHPEDRLSEVYRDRCLALEADPPGEDWDGVWVARSK